LVSSRAAFFMRKGADVLSKWVGEAERQLRMLFEEARAAQPSIIFFDEIDGASSFIAGRSRLCQVSRRYEAPSKTRSTQVSSRPCLP
jgi:SpoVK/Ycf46/Vps4 family AAA+-type ATPase